MTNLPSIDNVPITDREQATLYSFTHGTPHYRVVRQLYGLAHAQVNAAPAAQGMVQDAARYRHLRSRCPQWLLKEVFGGPIADSKREAQELLDAAIDSLRAVPHQPTGERNG